MGNTDRNTHQMWKLALLAGLCDGIGGVSIDLDHILNAATGGAVPWTLFHAPVVALALAIFGSGCLIALIGRLYSALVLGYRPKQDRSLPSV